MTNKERMDNTPAIEPYVTSRGGVVILNDPFPIDQARRVAALCKAAPDLLDAAESILRDIEDREKRTGIIQLVPVMDKLRAAIAKTRPA